jgi:hypothetical protein
MSPFGCNVIVARSSNAVRGFDGTSASILH